MKILNDVPLKQLHTFHFDYICKFYTAIYSIDDLLTALQLNFENKLILGNGSNSIFTKDFDGLIIHNKIPGIEIVQDSFDSVVLKCGGGVLWDDLIDFCCKNNLYGLENLVGIPGTVGAAPVQNIGAYGVEIANSIKKVDFIKFDSLELLTLNRQDCNFSYRNSIFKNELKNKGCITHVYFSLSKVPNFNLTYGSLRQNFVEQEPNLSTVVMTIKKIRNAKIPDPEFHSNAGSFFQNAIIKKSQTKDLLIKFPNLPVWSIDEENDKIASAFLIDQCGLKNFSKYGLKIHDKSPLVIVNENCHNGENLYKFVDEIKTIIFQKTNVHLTLEPNVF